MIRASSLFSSAALVTVTGALVTTGSAPPQDGPDGAPNSYVRLQGSTPGTQQTGHANIGGTLIAGQFQGGGAGLSGVNADLLDGLNSTAFLQSIPVPLTLSGTSDTHIIRGENASATNFSSGVFGLSTDATARSYGVVGQSNSPEGRGVYGYTPAGTGVTFGGWFESESVSGTGAYGTATSGTGTTYGVVGGSFSTGGRGVAGYAAAFTGDTYGVYGESRSTAGRGVYGLATAGTGVTYGVYGTSQSPSGTGVVGTGSWGVVGEGQGYGVIGNATTGVGMYAYNRNSTYNVALAGTSFGVCAVVGNTICIDGSSNNSTGVIGRSSSGTGVIGVCAEGTGVRGDYINRGNSGYLGLFNDGVYGEAASSQGNGLKGTANNGSSAFGVWGISTSGYAGYFSGTTHVAGVFTATTKNFKIDHPLDPETKYLTHSCVESDQRINIYKGRVVTNGGGEAWVQLPDYFEALNTDVEYNLTVIGQFARAIIGEEVSGNRFLIRTDKPNVKVSWQVFGVRQDAYARAHPMIVEEEKRDEERGTYLNPSEHGQPESKLWNFDKFKSAAEHRPGAIPPRPVVKPPPGLVK